MNMLCHGSAQRYMLLLWMLDQSAGIAGRKAPLTACERGVCVDGVICN
jgi:hypothetical protein